MMILVGAISTLNAHAGNWSLGGGALISANPYRSMKTNILPIPFLSYQGKNFAIYGPIAKLRLPIDKTNIIGMRFQLGMQEFDPKEASLASMQQLNERQRLFLIGPYYRARTMYGQFTGAMNYDVSQRSKGGMSLDLNYGYPYFTKSRRIFIRPGAGISWFNDKFGKHYYQITQAESVRSGLSQFQGKSFFQPFLSLFAGVNIAKKIYWTNIARVNYLPDRIYNSPMVRNSRFTYSLITGLTYEFGDKNQRFNH